MKSPITPFTPRELSGRGVRNQIDAFVRCARLAREAGYDGVEIMGSEGYLLNEFLIAETNHRTDEWGGPYAKRMRFPVEIVTRTREAVGRDFIVIYRLSMIDLMPGGSSWDEVVQLAKAIEAAGATLINTGIGWHEADPDDRDVGSARRVRVGDEEDEGRGRHSADHDDRPRAIRRQRCAEGRIRRVNPYRARSRADIFALRAGARP